MPRAGAYNPTTTGRVPESLRKKSLRHDIRPKPKLRKVSRKQGEQAAREYLGGKDTAVSRPRTQFQTGQMTSPENLEYSRAEYGKAAQKEAKAARKAAGARRAARVSRIPGSKAASEYLRSTQGRRAARSYLTRGKGALRRRIMRGGRGALGFAAAMAVPEKYAGAAGQAAAVHAAKTAGKTLVGKIALPAAAAMGAYDTARAVHEGTKAYKAGKEAKAYAARSAARYDPKTFKAPKHKTVPAYPGRQSKVSAPAPIATKIADTSVKQPKPKSAPKAKNVSFKQAFQAARRKQGSKGTFEWKGKKYHTKYKEEM